MLETNNSFPKNANDLKYDMDRQLKFSQISSDDLVLSGFDKIFDQELDLAMPKVEPRSDPLPNQYSNKAKLPSHDSVPQHGHHDRKAEHGHTVHKPAKAKVDLKEGDDREGGKILPSDNKTSNRTEVDDKPSHVKKVVSDDVVEEESLQEGLESKHDTKVNTILNNESHEKVSSHANGEILEGTDPLQGDQKILTDSIKVENIALELSGLRYQARNETGKSSTNAVDNNVEENIAVDDLENFDGNLDESMTEGELDAKSERRDLSAQAPALRFLQHQDRFTNKLENAVGAIDETPASEDVQVELNSQIEKAEDLEMKPVLINLNERARLKMALKDLAFNLNNSAKGQEAATLESAKVDQANNKSNAVDAASIKGRLSQLNDAKLQDNSALNSRIKTPMGDPKWGQKLVDKINWMASQNVHSARIHLEPSQMGAIDVRVSLMPEQANVTFTTAFSHVKDAIENNMLRLREMFEENGFEHVNVDVRDQGHEQGGSTDKESGDSKQGSLALNDLAEDSEESKEGRSISSDASLGLVDYYV